MTYEIENQAHADGYAVVCGVDEAGRGPLAGPVYAAAVILPDGLEELGINDSKKMTEKKREALFDIICDNAIAYGIGFATEKEIDEINILNATFLAMRRAVEAMGEKIAPKWLEIDKNAGVAKIIAMPERDDIDFEFNEQLIIELYSK